MNQLRQLFDRSLFGVCNYLGARMGLASSRVRVYFIYLSFATLGSPILIYLFAAFWLNLRQYLNRSRNIIWR